MSNYIVDTGSAAAKYKSALQVFGVTITPAASQTWGVEVYDSLTRDSTKTVLSATGITGASPVSPVSLPFTKGLELKTGLSYLLTQVSSVTFEVE